MIYATGDTHGNFERFQPEYFPEQAEMTKEDYMIIGGDFGGLWDGRKKIIGTWTGWNPYPSPCCLSAAITRTLICWGNTLSRNGTVGKSSASARM